MINRKRFRTALCSASVFLALLTAAPARGAASSAPLRVSDNQRFPVTTGGRPFFWLADTAWQLIYDPDEAEIRRYFTDRRDKGFTVIQTVAPA